MPSRPGLIRLRYTKTEMPILIRKIRYISLMLQGGNVNTLKRDKVSGVIINKIFSNLNVTNARTIKTLESVTSGWHAST